MGKGILFLVKCLIDYKVDEISLLAEKFGIDPSSLIKMAGNGLPNMKLIEGLGSSTWAFCKQFTSKYTVAGTIALTGLACSFQIYKYFNKEITGKMLVKRIVCILSSAVVTSASVLLTAGAGAAIGVSINPVLGFPIGGLIGIIVGAGIGYAANKGINALADYLSPDDKEILKQ